MSKFVNRILNSIQEPAVVGELTETMMWSTHTDTTIWESDKLVDMPFFYPVYNWQNFYSYTILPLLFKKGDLNLNHEALQSRLNVGPGIFSANQTIDKDIVRIGCQREYSLDVDDADEYASMVHQALLEDVAEIETLNPDSKNFILCGGKDSLNLLLLPWQNPVVALSAEPNYTLVKDFIDNNNLNIPLIKLEDEFDQEYLDDEILEGCCRADLSHWRWGIHLRKIAEESDKKIIFWKGQIGDLYLSTTWKNYIYPPREGLSSWLPKIYKRTSLLSPKWLNRTLGQPLQKLAYAATWEKAASLQGAHMGFLRSLTNSLVLSAYHGPKMSKVIHSVNLTTAANKDVRFSIGEMLLGRKVRYPEANPAPKPSGFRNQLNHPDKFQALIKPLLN